MVPGNRSTTTIFGDRSRVFGRPMRGPGRLGKATAIQRVRPSLAEEQRALTTLIGGAAGRFQPIYASVKKSPRTPTGRCENR